MMTTILVMILCTSLIILTHNIAPGDAVVNLIASFVVMVIVTTLLPGMDNLPVFGYPVAWILLFAGMQFLMPLGSGSMAVRRYPHATAIRIGRVMVGVAVA